MDSQFADIENSAIELITMDISTTQENPSFFTWSHKKPIHKSKSCPNALTAKEATMCKLSTDSSCNNDLDIFIAESFTPTPPIKTQQWVWCISIDKYEFVNHHFSIFLHVSIMISFEIFFYFTYIVNIERNEILKKIGDYISDVKKVETTGDILVIDFLVNTQEFQDYYAKVYTEYLESNEEQKEKLHKLLRVACYISIPLYFIFVVFLSYGLYQKRNIKWKWITYENLLMFLCLGIFEYLFFTQIILHYDPITDAELEYYLVQGFL